MTYGLKCTACSKFTLAILSNKLALCETCHTIHNLNKLFTDYFNSLCLFDITPKFTKKEVKAHIGLPLSGYAINKYLSVNFTKASKHSQFYYYKL